jgi:hypothetical protein
MPPEVGDSPDQGGGDGGGQGSSGETAPTTP